MSGVVRCEDARSSARVRGKHVSALLRACRQGCVSEAEHLLIQHGCELLAEATSPQTCPLAEAALSGNRALCDMVIAQDRGQLAWVSDNGESVLFNAALSGSVDVLELLVCEGSLSCARRNAQGASPAFFAAARGKLEAVRWICRHTRGVLRHTNEQRESFASVACKKGRLEIVEWLVAQKVDLSNFYIVSESPFLAACRTGQEKVVRFLVDRGVALEPHRSAFTDDASNALAASAMGGHDDLVAFFLDKHVFSVQSYLEAIKKAVTSNYPHVALQILDALQTNKTHHPANFVGHAMDALIRCGHTRHALRLLNEYSSHECFAQGLVPFLISAMQSGKLHLVKWVVTTDIEHRETSASALQVVRRLSLRSRPSKFQRPAARELAASVAASKLMPALVNEGLQENRFHLLRWLVLTLRLPASAFVWAKTTALHRAAAAAHTEAAFFFAEEMGLPVHTRDSAGNLPVHVAAKAGATTIVRMLLVNASPATARNATDRQPLGLALLHDRNLTAHVLREAPSLTPIHIALAGHMHGLLASKLRSGVLNPEDALQSPSFGSEMPTFVQLAKNMLRSPALGASNSNDRLQALLRPNVPGDTSGDNHDNEDHGADSGGEGDGEGESSASGSGDRDSVDEARGGAAGGAGAGAGDDDDDDHEEGRRSGTSHAAEHEGNGEGGEEEPARGREGNDSKDGDQGANDGDVEGAEAKGARSRGDQRRNARECRALVRRTRDGQLVISRDATAADLMEGHGGGVLNTVLLPPREACVVTSVLGTSMGPIPRHVSLDALHTVYMAVSLSKPWHPEGHRFYTAPHRALVFRTLLCFGHERLRHVPQEHIFEILKYITRASTAQ